MSHWVILGCGYTAARAAARLAARGTAVTATTRSADRACALSRELGETVNVATLDPHLDPLLSLPLAGATVLHSIPPTSATAELESAISSACADAGAARLIYLSSTGVYGRGDGGWMDENTAEGPLGEHGTRRLTAERVIARVAMARGLEAVSLRVAGIYGPGRGVHERLRRGDYRIYGDGASQVSRVHVDDLATAIIAAGDVETLLRSRYCVADDAPTSSREHADGVAALLGVAPPVSVPLAEASPAALAMLTANRRISNRLAKAELGLALRYPSWREGVPAAIAQGW